MLVTLILYSIFYINNCLGLHDGDRILTTIQTLHSGWKTPHLDLSLNELPTFRKASTAVISITMPRPDENGLELALDITQDVKLSFTFDHGKLVIPWITIYDAKKHHHVSSIKFQLIHDEFDVLRVYHDEEYDEKPIDENQRDLPDIELYYEYSSLQEEDLVSGIFAMFSLGLCGVLILFYITMITYDDRFIKTTSSKTNSNNSKVN